ncbi:MAG: flagellar basal body rod modification protein [Rhodobacteraceae bacterium]|nr:flagellar basal body rod modification protein [Paracoccaceae bacterium]
MTTAVTATPATGTTTPAATATAAPAINANFNMFLTMLTTQLKNQDPMNPTDSSQFAVQLATFSGVEQQTQTNQILQGLAGQFGSMGMTQLAGWVGMEARVTAPTAFGGSPITLAPSPEAGADKTVLIVTDASGKQVASQALPVSGAPTQWDGKDDSGATLPDGNYTFALENYAKGTLIGTDPVESYARVAEVQSGVNGAVLVLDGGAQVDASSVTALRAAN